MNGNFNSVLLETAVDELSKLPGIGRKTALRLALHLLRKEEQAAYSLGEALIRMRRDVCYFPLCHIIPEEPLYTICSIFRRDTKIGRDV